MIAIPLILQRLKDGITKKISEKGVVFEELFNFCMAYKKKWVDLGYTTPIVDAVFFSRITKILGGSLSHVIVGGAPMGDDLQTFCRSEFYHFFYQPRRGLVIGFFTKFLRPFINSKFTSFSL